MPFKRGYTPWNKGLKGKQCHSEETRKTMCESRQREKNCHWNGGFKKDGNGYVGFKVPKGCKFSCMKNSYGYVPIHRLVMAEYLQRPLRPEEVVHHENGDITDNRIENLGLFENQGEHIAYHHRLMKGEI